MTTAQVAQQLVEMCRRGEFMEAVEALYARDIVSIEPMSMGPNLPQEVRGIDAVRRKGEWWVANHEIHSMNASGPFVHGERFVVIFDMDVTSKADGKRHKGSEAGLYTVADGKVVREEFFYGLPPGGAK
jgi:hypothetical protein